MVVNRNRPQIMQSHTGSPLYSLLVDLAHYAGCPSLLDNFGCWENTIAGDYLVAVNAHDSYAYNSLGEIIKPFEIKVYFDRRFCARFSIVGDCAELTGEISEAEIFEIIKAEIRRYNLACFV